MPRRLSDQLNEGRIRSELLAQFGLYDVELCGGQLVLDVPNGIAHTDTEVSVELGFATMDSRE
jgi:hypothetical protein